MYNIKRNRDAISGPKINFIQARDNHSPGLPRVDSRQQVCGHSRTLKLAAGDNRERERAQSST